jgi:diguanylate cyclase (GGDEF)-like protein
MKRTKGFTIRTTVNLLVVISVLTTLSVCAFIGYRSEKQSLTQMTFQLNEVYAVKISDTVNGLFNNMKQSLRVTGEYLSRDLSRTDLREQMVLFQRGHTYYNSIFIVDRDGILIEGSSAEPQTIGHKITSEGIIQANEKQQSFVSEPYISSTTGKLIVLVSEPLWDSTGNYLGFIGGSIRLHETSIFQTVLGTIPHQSNGSYAYVVSSTGYILYHPDANRIGDNVDKNPVVIKILEGESGTARVMNTKGIDMLASYSYINEAGWGIVSQTPNDFVISAARSYVMKLVLYMLPVLLLFMAMIYWLVGKMSAPLSKLAEFASSLSPSGKEELPQIHNWNHEANELNLAFGMALRHFRYQYEHLSLEAKTDPLTGLFNRRTMDLLVKTWITQQLPFSMLVMDIDHFKNVNDTYGHDKGDQVLIFLANSLQRMLSEHYVICRFGGEEFVVLALHADFDEAIKNAETIRKYMAETDSPTGQKVTVSIGISHYPGFAHDAEQLFRFADEAMYRAKRLGRNRVELEEGAVFREHTN